MSVDALQVEMMWATNSNEYFCLETAEHSCDKTQYSRKLFPPIFMSQSVVLLLKCLQSSLEIQPKTFSGHG